MAYAKDVARQYPLVALATVSIGQLTSGAALEAIDIPAGATVLGGWYECTVAFNSQTSDAVTVSMNGHTYVTDADATALEHTAFTMPTTTSTGLNAVSVPDTIDVTWTGVGTKGTTGTVLVYVEYILSGRVKEIQP